MNSEVLITIKGMQFGSEDASESIADVYEGKFLDKGGIKYLMYYENIEGTEQDTKCLIKIGINEVTVTKRGAVNVEMPFKVGRKQLTNYDTTFGGFTLGFKTKNIACHEQEDLIELDIDYRLEMNYEYLADCHININVQNKTPS